MALLAFPVLADTDTVPPTAPAALTATAASSSRIDLGWPAASDNVGVQNYRVERCTGAACTAFVQIATPYTRTLADSGRSASTTYQYRVRAQDAAGNIGPYSPTASATTPAPSSDTEAPGAPGGLAATAVSGTQINLNWTKATDNVGVKLYRVERCSGAACTNFAQIATPSTTSLSDAGRTTGATYRYRVRAQDAASNIGPYSAIASATTPTPPKPISFMQVNAATPQGSPRVVTVTYQAAQTGGDLNVVVVGWSNYTTHVASIHDSKNNVYQLAAGPTIRQDLSQSIYYASNIAAAAAGTNTVTVTFDNPVAFPDVRIAEYSGIATSNPLDGSSGAAAGSGTLINSGTFATTNANDLIVAGDTGSADATGPGVGYTQRIITTPDGGILEDRVVSAAGNYSATAQTTNGAWVMQAAAFKGAIVTPRDVTPPSVTFSAPAAGANLTGTSVFTANAVDTESAIGGVQFQIDGVSVGLPVVTPPYSLSFATAQFANGSHTLTAYAWDAPGNIGRSSPVTVTFTNEGPADPAQSGYWSGAASWPLVAVHANLMHTGKVLVWDGQSFGGNDAKIWDPGTGQFLDVRSPANIFCAGQTQLGDGRILVNGGHVASHVGIRTTSLFDPSTGAWKLGASMQFARWYPTLTTLPDGRAITMSGETSCDHCFVDTPEIYDPGTDSWVSLTNATLVLPYYPHMYVLPDGRLLAAGTSEEPIVSRVLDLNTNTWSTVDGALLDGGSSAMFLPGKVVKSGSSENPDVPGGSSSPNTYVLDMTVASPAWRSVAGMAFPRAYHTLTILPDGDILATGGGRTGNPVDLPNAVYEAEVWSPGAETWTTLAPMHTPRLYHSLAVLLPDARVLIAGGGRLHGSPMPAEDQLSAEIFAPPYLFRGPRPVIGNAPSQLAYGQNFNVQTPDASRIVKVALVGLAAVTHTINMNQRYVPLGFSVGSGALSVTAPSTSNIATPGYYMLFLIDSNGVPSVAALVKL